MFLGLLLLMLATSGSFAATAWAILKQKYWYAVAYFIAFGVSVASVFYCYNYIASLN